MRTVRAMFYRPINRIVLTGSALSRIGDQLNNEYASVHAMQRDNLVDLRGRFIAAREDIDHLLNRYGWWLFHAVTSNVVQAIAHL